MNYFIIIIVVIILLFLYFNGVFSNSYSFSQQISQQGQNLQQEEGKTELDILNDQLRKNVQEINQLEFTKRIRQVRTVREGQCREIFQKIFAPHEFPSCRPKFLLNPATQKCLELDGYNPQLQLAFEYNGIQHYEFPNYFHNSQEEFQKQLQRDRLKSEICKERGIKLIIIPYHVRDLESFIRRELYTQGITIPIT